MASVTADHVRDRVKASATDIEDAKVTEFIKDAEAAAIENLAAIYAWCTHAVLREAGPRGGFA